MNPHKPIYGRRPWIDAAYETWLAHGGTMTLRQAVDATAPPTATEDERRRTLSAAIAECQTIHNAILEYAHRVEAHP